MLDSETFKIVEQLSESKRILCYASKGILPDFESILDHKGTYYDSVLTNSLTMIDRFNANGVECRHFKFYPAPLFESEIRTDRKYSHDFTYLGGGFQRISSNLYDKERELIYANPLVHKYGAGWSGVPSYHGVLPPEDIGALYHSSTYSLATIEPAQRAMGMINNRYCEIAKSRSSIISVDYPEMDFFGLEEFVIFATDPDLTRITDRTDTDRAYEFIMDKERDFFTSLKELL